MPTELIGLPIYSPTLTLPATRSYQEMADQDTPDWGTYYQNFYHAIGAACDATADGLTDAVAACFVETCPEDALDKAGRDRGLPRGTGEATSAYRARLVNAWIAYQEGGTKLGIQNRLSEAGFTGAQVVEDRDWGADAYSGTRWWRFWVVFPLPNTFRVPMKWEEAGTKWDDGRAWDYCFTKDQLSLACAIVRKWMGAHNFFMGFVIQHTGYIWEGVGQLWEDGRTWGGHTTYEAC